MVSFREVSVLDDSAQALLAEYFSARTLSFPGDQGTYKTTLPDAREFVPPRGVFLVVEGEDLAGDASDVGCGGIRKLDDPANAAGARVRYEVKHLWLQPHTRGLGLGRALLAELERSARALGATELVLDTNASLEAAGGLYRSSGFTEIEPYNSNPNATTWLGKLLG
ncbi:ribosomal protein S18 acetylase RimI-like enzyme [Glaciihabitans tibetensis]|uniref:Ribosomal protein S18 acetylase RimI-like enzyme n=1 Tax=Glaciihabitans tibetensis TaxID=1266600 RepID=A0A2T0VI07_9MICO|nr:GNAT family N-acetyltransferase [Glaciihabitans tibetensis]PRY69703.1 ribosomal protein S18 acetylase RimI-like enzyme [Glaciihabitans tibetensis]